MPWRRRRGAHARTRGSAVAATNTLDVQDFTGIFIIQAIGVGCALVLKALIYVCRVTLGGRFGIDPPARDVYEAKRRISTPGAGGVYTHVALMSRMRELVEEQQGLLESLEQEATGGARKEADAPAARTSQAGGGEHA